MTAPAILTYGTFNGLADGWDWQGRSLIYYSGSGGTGAARLEISNGAYLLLEKNILGQTTIVGHPSGAYPTTSTATTTARVNIQAPAGAFPAPPITFTASGTGFTFNGTAQVLLDKGAVTIGSNVTIGSGIVGFQGNRSSTSTTYDGVFGTGIGSHTLSIANGATAIMDVRFLADVTSTTAGGLVINDNLAVADGGTLSFRQTIAGGTVSRIGVTGDITGTGSIASEAVVDIRLAAGSGAGQLDLGTPGATGCDLIVNGTGPGGLKVQGSASNLTAYTA